MKQKEQEEINKPLDFGDYCKIEQFRYGCDNELYVHKVIGRLRSNTWVDVPVKHTAAEVMHDTIEDVVLCICCGVSEKNVLKYRDSDVTINTLSELRKLSESETGRTDEELVHKIESVIKGYEYSFLQVERMPTYIAKRSVHVKEVSKEIAKIIPSSRCQEKEINVDLLEAAKYFRNIVIPNWHHIEEDSKEASKHLRIITNAEKQTN